MPRSVPSITPRMYWLSVTKPSGETITLPAEQATYEEGDTLKWFNGIGVIDSYGVITGYPDADRTSAELHFEWLNDGMYLERAA